MPILEKMKKNNKISKTISRALEIKQTDRREMWTNQQIPKTMPILEKTKV